ncbi:MAG: esterase-like activity of phytase family protein [Chitinophagaceae bacterium]|nr:esterase-like activity of phytase family protein [Chitinophagaceae bacterium]
MYPRFPKIKSALRTPFLFIAIILLVLQSATAQKGGYQLKFLQEYILPNNTVFENTKVGGLSGIDYDSASGLYYSICDDGSDLAPARFYTYTIDFKNDRIDAINLKGVHYLRNSFNRLFLPFSKNKMGSVDPEALRVLGDKIIWSDEGVRNVSPKGLYLTTPRIFLADKEGNYEASFDVPEVVEVSREEKGTRNNGGFEGLAITPDKKYLYASVEEPLIQDGPRAGLNDSTGIVRIIKFDIETRQPVAQYAYQIDPVAYPVKPENGFRVNGISDIMFLNDDQLLVIERSFSMGRLPCTIKVYMIDLTKATDISEHFSLKGKESLVVPKKLILNMDTLNRFTDNIEGVTFGPTLSNGSPSLIFVSDNNFNPLERTQFLLFELQKRAN